MAAVTVDKSAIFDSEHHLVTLRASDGDETKRPAETQLQDIRGPNGERDFYDRPSPQVKKDWLEEVGTYLAKMKGRSNLNVMRNCLSNKWHRLRYPTAPLDTQSSAGEV
jgi:hypothetical protein